MDYLSDPAVLTPVLVLTVHFVTAAGFWFCCRRRTLRAELGNFSLSCHLRVDLRCF